MVAEELHVGRAARRLVISQAALTQRIQRLERELGFLLFTRAERRIALTPAGVVVLERARRLLGDVDEMVDSAAHVSSGRLGSLRIGHTGAAVYGALTPVVRHLREDVPDVELVLVELKTAPQIELVNAGSLDAGFIHLPRSSLTGVCVLELDDEHKVVALPAEHPLARHRQINLGQLAREPFILFDRLSSPTRTTACTRRAVVTGSSLTSCR